MAKRLATQLIIAAFQDEQAVDAIEKAITDAEWESKKIICTNMAIAKKDIAGKVKVKELGNPSSFESAAVGGTIGAGLVGGMSLLLLGPAGVVAGAAAGGATGAAIAGYGASKIEGLDKSKLQKLGSALGPGNSAIVLVFDEVVVKKSDYEKFLTEYKESTDVLVERMAKKISETLKSGSDIAYQMTIGDDGIAAQRFIIGEDAAKINNIVLTPEFVSSEELNATEDRVAMEAAMATPEAVATARASLRSSVCRYEFAAVTEDEAVYEAAVFAKDKQLEG